MDDKDRRKGYYEDITTFLVGHTFHTRFFLSRMTRRSRIFKKIIDKILFEDDEVYVLPNKNAVNKTITTNIEVNQSFQKDDSEFVPSQIIKEVIKEAEDIVIMHKCLCRTSANCEDYPQDFGCIFIGPASRKIASKYGRSATVEEALAHVGKADELGLSHVIGRNKIDSVWMNVRPKEKLLTICHCCPCCCLWKVLPDLDDDISNKVMGNAIYIEDGKISIDQDKCVGCGHCVQTCKFDAIELNYSQKSIDSVLNRIGELVDYKK